MNTENLDKYFITYSNYFKIGNKTFAFRKKYLFDVTVNPKLIKQVDNNNCQGYWIDRNFYSLNSLSELVIKNPLTVDVSQLQWYRQCELDECFKL